MFAVRGLEPSAVLHLKYISASGKKINPISFLGPGRKDEIGVEGIETVFAPPEPCPGLTLHQPTLSCLFCYTMLYILCFCLSPDPWPSITC